MRGIIRTSGFIFLSALLFLCGMTATARAASDTYAFLYMPGIPGSSPEPAHRNWIEVISCDFGSVPAPRGSMLPLDGEGKAGKLHFGDFSFEKEVDRSSRMLALCCQSKVQLSHIRIELTGSDLGQFKSLILRKVKILSVEPGKKKRDGKDTEIVTVSFKQVEYQ